MKKSLWNVLVASFALVVGSLAQAAPVPKVTICHFPPGNPANVQVITVGAPAVPAHIANHNDAVCPAGDSNCCFGGNNPSLCTNFQTDVNNCGGCGNVCRLPNATPACTSGACTISSCNPGFGNCDNNTANGCETTLNTASNCGACGNACAAGASCTGGSCVCPSGDVVCNGACVDESTDNNNCGACGKVCTADATCTDGTCVVACPSGEILCGGTCVDPNTDPNNCGGCGTACAAGDSCAAGTCVPPAVSGACLPASSLSILIQGTNVSSYVPNGSWGAGPSLPDVQLVPLEGGGSRATVATGAVVNSCSSNSLTGETVCTGNLNDVYLITGSVSSPALTAGSDGTVQSFSGGSCQTCGVAVNSGNNTAVLSVALASAGAYQTLHLATNTFDPPIPTGGGNTSEDIVVDPARHLVLSPNESSNYQLLNTLTGAVFNNNISPFAEFDSAGEDCSTGIALATMEFTQNLFIADLTQATFVPGSPGTWSAPSQVQAFPEFVGFGAGTSGIAVAPGSHLGIVTGEFGTNAFGVILLPSTSGSGTPAVVDWVATTVPDEPNGSFSLGTDPHTVSAYTSPNSGKALGVMADNPRGGRLGGTLGGTTHRSTHR